MKAPSVMLVVVACLAITGPAAAQGGFLDGLIGFGAAFLNGVVQGLTAPPACGNMPACARAVNDPTVAVRTSSGVTSCMSWLYRAVGAKCTTTTRPPTTFTYRGNCSAQGKVFQTFSQINTGAGRRALPTCRNPAPIAPPKPAVVPSGNCASNLPLCARSVEDPAVTVEFGDTGSASCMDWFYSGVGAQCSTTGDVMTTFTYKGTCNLGGKKYQTFGRNRGSDCRNPMPVEGSPTDCNTLPVCADSADDPSVLVETNSGTESCMEWAYARPGSTCTTTTFPPTIFTYKAICDVNGERYQTYSQLVSGDRAGSFDCRNPEPLS